MRWCNLAVASGCGCCYFKCNSEVAYGYKHRSHREESPVPTTVDAEVAEMQKPYTGFRFEFSVDRVEPMRLFSFRWHPFAMETGVDYSKEPTTLVVFELEEASGGTMLTVSESGFDRIPIERRAKAFAANEGGWTAQMKLIEKYLALAA